MKDGLALTPTVLKAIVFAPRWRAPSPRPSRGRLSGQGYRFPPRGLSGLHGRGGGDRADPGRSRASAPALAAWLEALRSRQLTEDLGWCPTDAAYGAWGDAVSPSSNADSGRAADADISSTLFALGASENRGAGADEPAVRKALGFVVRCQNFADDRRAADPAFDDGGFFFTPTDPVRNKAGVAGTDRRGREPYHSYGSATADGLGR